ncbi:MAG: hypothetical protein ACE5LU_25615 [Anaerolineae bacterium]
MSSVHNSPGSESLTARDAWEDYLSLKRALTDDDKVVASVPVSSGTLTLVQELIETGVCQSEAEVVSRAVRSFFVAVFPREPERQRVLEEATTRYRTG